VSQCAQGHSHNRALDILIGKAKLAYYIILAKNSKKKQLGATDYTDFYDPCNPCNPVTPQIRGRDFKTLRISRMISDQTEKCMGRPPAIGVKLGFPKRAA
jgi:hypothetical protein